MSAEGRVEHQKLNQVAAPSFWCSIRLLMSVKKCLSYLGKSCRHNQSSHYSQEGKLTKILSISNPNVRTFKTGFQHPIENGQCADSTQVDMKLMRQRSYILHEKLRGFVHRRDYSSIRYLSHDLGISHTTFSALDGTLIF